MRVAIIGYGKMGKLIRSLALSEGHDIVLVVDPMATENEVTSKHLEAQSFGDVDVAIDFSVPSSIIDNMRFYSEMKIPAVIGTTGWYDRMDYVKTEVASEGCALLWSGNFSLGVHLFFAIVRHAASLCNLFPAYDVMVHEWHHNAKADSPSGTASMLGEILLSQLRQKQSVETSRLDRTRRSTEIHVSSSRGGYMPGMHEVVFDSPVDTIELIHRARNREGFAYGVLRAAEWISDGRKGFFSIDDMLSDMFPVNANSAG